MNPNPTTYATDREAISAAVAHFSDPGERAKLITGVILDHLSRVAPAPAPAPSTNPTTYSPDLLDSYLRIVYGLGPEEGYFGNDDREAMARLLAIVAPANSKAVEGE